MCRVEVRPRSRRSSRSSMPHGSAPACWSSWRGVGEAARNRPDPSRTTPLGSLIWPRPPYRSMARPIAAACLLATALVLAFAPSADADVCRREKGCDFWDGNYHEYILYEVDTPQVDVLIVPPASPFATRDIETVGLAVQQWQAGIAALADPWFEQGFAIRSYTAGVDVPAADAAIDPEILVLTAEYNPVLLFGIGLQTPVGVCVADESTFHQHTGSPWASAMAECGTGGMACLAINTSFLLGGERLMHDLVAHEFGHCLGIGHVGDALDFNAKTVPMDDIMSYQEDPAQVHCVSSLNVKALQAVYAGLLGQPGFLPAGSYYHMSPSAYSQ